MPFEFTGEAPTLGGDSNTVNLFSISASNTAASPFLSFGATPPFGSTSTWNQTPSFASPFSTSAPSKLSTPTAKAPTTSNSFVQQPLPDNTITTTRPKTDRLSRSLDSIKLKRTAIFGADVAAHDVISSYVATMSADGAMEEIECATKLDAMLDELAKAHPEAMKFLQHVFERAVSSNTAAVRRVDPYTYSDQLRDEAGEKTPEAPDVYVDIEPRTRLYNACQTAINHRMRSDNYFYHYNSYYEIGTDVTALISDDATRADVRQFLSTGAHGRFTPSTNNVADVDQFVDGLFELILQMKKQFKNGWVVQGRDEASYFGQGLDRQNEVKSLERWAADRKKKDTGFCCPYRDEDLWPRTPVPDTPFRLMDLPAELRNNIYRKTLVPGTVSLESCHHKNPRGTYPQLAPALLITCRQIYEEAKDLFWENTWQVTYTPDHVGVGRSAIHMIQLPLHALSKIKSLVLLINCIRFYRPNCDPTSLHALTSLENLRIIAIEDANDKHIPTLQTLAAILKDIVTRIPASCDVHYGSRPGEDVLVMKRMIHKFKNKWVEPRITPDEVEDGKETDVARLREAAQLVPDGVGQGSESGKPPTRRNLPGDFKSLPKLGL